MQTDTDIQLAHSPLELLPAELIDELCEYVPSFKDLTHLYRCSWVLHGKVTPAIYSKFSNLFGWQGRQAILI
jgi:hypothetical protein